MWYHVFVLAADAGLDEPVDPFRLNVILLLTLGPAQRQTASVPEAIEKLQIRGQFVWKEAMLTHAAIDQAVPPKDTGAPVPATLESALPEPTDDAPPITTYAFVVPSKYMVLLIHFTVLPGVNVQLPAEPVSIGG